jgi:hypothetical protein
MTIEEALHKAVAEGYHTQSFDGIEMYYSGANNEYSVWTRKDNHSSFMEFVEKTFLDLSSGWHWGVHWGGIMK